MSNLTGLCPTSQFLPGRPPPPLWGCLVSFPDTERLPCTLAFVFVCLAHLVQVVQQGMSIKSDPLCVCICVYVARVSLTQIVQRSGCSSWRERLLCCWAW